MLHGAGRCFLRARIVPATDAETWLDRRPVLDPMPYVNHYSFHILDPDWGHLTIKISGHPSFAAQVMLNGHE